MKNYLIVPAITLLLLTACKEEKDSKKENELKEPPISALSIIKGQLNHLDTSFYEVRKFEITGDITDTAFLKRNEIRIFAAPFLSLPEIADEKYHEKYTEDKLIDGQQNTLNITSIAKSDTAEVQKQIVVIGLSPTENSKVQSIFIDRYISKGDSTIEQKLFWEIDKYFSIGSIVEKGNQPDKITTTKVAWQ